MTNRRTFFRSHPDLFCKKGALEYLGELTGKHVAWNFILKEADAKAFSCDMFKILQNSFFIVQCTRESLPLI